MATPNDSVAPEAAPPAAEGTPGVPGWRGWLPLGFIVAVLLTLVVAPLVVDAETEELREEIDDLAEPAQVLASQLQFTLAREMSALRGFLLTGDPRFLGRYQVAYADELEVRRELRPLAGRLGRAVEEAYQDYREGAAAWHRRIEEAGIIELRRAPEEYLRRLGAEQAEYEDLLESTLRLEDAISAAADGRRGRIEAAERLQAAITAVLVVLALIAAGLVAWIYRRMRTFARQLHTRVRQEARLRWEVERLMESKARLIRGFTHDLKNPLGAADGYASLLTEGTLGPLSPRQQEGAARIREVLGSALAIIDDLVELSRAEVGKLEIDRSPARPTELVRRAAEDYRPSANAAGLELRVDVPDALPEAVTDPDRVHQVLGNLLSNATKYTPPGGRVTVRANRRSAPHGPGPGDWLAIAVSDTGPGIPPESREEIFHEFHRLGGGGTGAGLGLAISRRIARLLGGDITVESRVGQGSTFILWLPLDGPRPEREHVA